MTALNEQLMLAVIFRPRCKLWSCESCAVVNQQNWTNRAVHGAHVLQNQGYEIDMVTVTAHEKHDVQRAVNKLPDQWNKLRNRWQRTVDKPQYMLTSEVGGEGHFHLHMITTGSISERWWKDNARKSGFGFMAKESESRIEAWKAGFYISKYLSKGMDSHTWEKGFHRVRTSRFWPKMDRLEHELSFTFKPLGKLDTVQRTFHTLAAQGYSVALADEKDSWHVLKTGELTGTASWMTMNTPNTYAT